MNPKISVIIPVYNHEKFLKETIESVLNQTFEDFELLINDDCSTDGSAEIIKSFSDERITAVFSKKNCGTVASLNRLVNMAKGEYIAVMGSDDVWLPEKLEKQLAVLEENPQLAVSFTNAVIIDGASQPFTESNQFPLDIFNYENKDKAEILYDFFLGGNRFCHSSALIRTSVHQEVGLYNPLYRQLHDFDLWVRILLRYNVHFSDSKLVKYRFIENINNMSASTESNNMRLYNEAKCILLQLFNNISDTDFLNGFNGLFSKKQTSDSVGIICEKFLILREKALWATSCKTLPIDFLVDKLNDEVVERLEKDYGVSIRDIYHFTGEYCANFDSQSYSVKKLTDQHAANLQALLDEAHQTNQTLSQENDALKQEIKSMKSFVFCKIEKKVRSMVSKRSFRRKKL